MLLSSVFGAAAVIFFSALLLRSSSNDKAYDLGGIPIFTAWSFFRRRYDFIQDGFRESGGKTFQFKVLQHRIVSLGGESSRNVFFNTPGLSLPDGYRILMGGAPKLKDLNIQITSDGVDAQAEVDEGFIKRVLSLVCKERLEDGKCKFRNMHHCLLNDALELPVLLDDMSNRISAWGTGGTVDPFKDVYDFVFQMTIRMATCQELAADQDAVDQIAKTYWALEQSATPVSLLLPWFPGPAKKARNSATTKIYKLLLKYVENRRNAAIPSTDPMDILIAEGHSNHAIIGTITGFLFAGVINTGMTACWILLHLGSNATWKKRVLEEYNIIVEKYTDTLSTQPLHKRLATIPLHAWENELPSMDLVTQETLRMATLGSVIRRNRLLQDVTVDGAVIKPGEFMTYQLADAHMNPNIYTEPMKFDPERYSEGRQEDSKETFSFLSWGAGRHPCAGMRLAKLELKLSLALILLGFEYELVDGAGKYPKAIPVSDRNDIHKVRPLGEPCYLKVRRVIE
ncbi:hypothetical protein GALMADRAFT_68731 [Galerina marginata CBS 339.88]|uniref:Cytochrome P450 n=1 Tax=Galerina marginata (strain CBS 339.88) TaxID=685588 RepID=A0A067SZW3_GALM3|nr:hypothetical protein GALMADRAFT_68731 [Galerina marginata CBS 339.88]